MWHRQSKALLALSLALTGFIVLQMLMYAACTLFGWKAFQYNLLWLCTRWVHAYGIRAADTFMALFVLGTIGHLAWLTGRQIVGASRAARKIRGCLSPELTMQLNRRFGTDGREDIVAVASSAPVALTVGFVRPTIVLSEGLLAMLNDEELEAVVHHERFHSIHRDPLLLMLVMVCARAFWYIPLLQWCHRQFAVTREMLADRYAAGRASAYGLGSALLKLARNARKPGHGLAVATFAGQSVALRIEQLVNPGASGPKLALPMRESLVSVIVYGMLFAAFALSML
ncbi:M56 family metallopeptidase [Paenibacillus thailandensis]|uniref:M56 family metallopeptidase n=1 Tax=Paenibacillus thailandensis TaxID=393250 RepID=A0ABW5R0R5_9BACL